MTDRKFLPPFAELLDRLIIDQIKEVKLPAKASDIHAEMDLLWNDIDVLIAERGLRLSASLIAAIAAMAQINLEIWSLKDRMSAEQGDYMENLKRAHQLNGVRNQIKNRLLEACGDAAPGMVRTNFNTDGLEGWDLYVLKKQSPDA